MLCDQQPRLGGRAVRTQDKTPWWANDEICGSKQFKILTILKLVEWVHSYSSFDTLGEQIERLILNDSFIESMRQFPFTVLRIAKLLKREELFQFALAGALAKFDDPLYGTNPKDDNSPDTDAMLSEIIEVDGRVQADLFSYGRGREDDENEIPQLSENDFAIRVEEDRERNQAASAKALRKRYRQLEEQLGCDQDLVLRVFSMHRIMSRRYDEQFDKWCDILRNVQADLQYPQTTDLTRFAWSEWLDADSKCSILHRARLALRILHPAGSVDWVMSRVPQTVFLSPGSRTRLRANFACMLGAARTALNVNGILIEDVQWANSDFCCWDISSEIDEYRYPWQPVERRRESELSLLDDAVEREMKI